MQFSHLLGQLKLNQQEFSFQFQSHPEYPSALAFSDTLNFMGIRNDAYELEKEFWGELPEKFITICNENFALTIKDGDFYKIFSDNTTTISKDDLYNRSSNFVLLFENEDLSKNKDGINYKYFIYLLSGLLFIYSLVIYDLFVTIYNTLSILGIFISLELFNKKFGKESPVINNICGVSSAKSQESCSIIINSDTTNILGLKLADLGLNYFIGLLMIGVFFPSAGLIFKVITVLSVCVILYSVYVQLIVKKAFCKVCVLIISLLIFQIYISQFYFNNAISANVAFLSAIILLVSMILLSYINNLLFRKEEYQKASIKYLRFKRNYEIFRRELFDNKQINFESKNIFFLGSTHSKIHISLISNPYCGFCKDAHKILDQLLEKYQGEISAQVRFNYSAQKKDETNLINDFVYVYNHSQNHFLEAVGKWFVKRNAQNIRDYYNPGNVTSDLTEVSQITAENQSMGFNFTPVFLINGFQFPDKYDREDIFYFIDDLLEEEKFSKKIFS